MPVCTSIAMKTGDFYFGRNMDLEYEFGERVVITPRNYPFEFRKAGLMRNHYAIIGMATVADGYPLYAEAVNEKGLCIAGLNFPGNAFFSPQADPEKSNISPFELVPWLLGRCATLEEARKLLETTQLVAIPFSNHIQLSPLHWHIADQTGSIVLEATKNGMMIFENPFGVMTNNPPFSFQMENVCQYMNLMTGQPENCFSKVGNLQPFGLGLGSFGLPGDFSPASRFVKAAYLSTNSICDLDENSSVSQFFRILASVGVPRGSVVLPDGKLQITTYSCCINVSKGIYYYTSYFNHQITAVHLKHENLNGSYLLEYPLKKTQQIAWAN